MRRYPVLAALGLAATTTAAAEPTKQTEWRWSLAKYAPPPRVPADNPMSEEKFQLGRRLFFDKRLSGNGTISCSSCHLQKRAFTDGRVVSVGSTGEKISTSARKRSAITAKVALISTISSFTPEHAKRKRRSTTRASTT